LLRPNKDNFIYKKGLKKSELPEKVPNLPLKTFLKKSLLNLLRTNFALQNSENEIKIEKIIWETQRDKKK